MIIQLTRKILFEETNLETGDNKSVGLSKHRCRLRIDHKDVRFIYCSFLAPEPIDDDPDSECGNGGVFSQTTIPCTAIALHGDGGEIILVSESIEAVSNCLDHAEQLEVSGVTGRPSRSNRSSADGSWSRPILASTFEGPSVPKLAVEFLEEDIEEEEHQDPDDDD